MSILGIIGAIILYFAALSVVEVICFVLAGATLLRGITNSRTGLSFVLHIMGALFLFLVGAILVTTLVVYPFLFNLFFHKDLLSLLSKPIL